MRKTAGTALLVLAVAPLSARAQDVSVDYDKTYDFSKIKTFAVELKYPPKNPLQAQRIVAEVEGALTAKGWTKVDAAAADAVAGFHVANRTQRSLSTMYSGTGGWRWGGMGTSQTTVQEYNVGTLIVDIFDAKSKSLFFRGIAKGVLSEKAEKNTKNIQKAIAKMFKDFPPGSEKK